MFPQINGGFDRIYVLTKSNPYIDMFHSTIAVAKVCSMAARSVHDRYCSHEICRTPHSPSLIVTSLGGFYEPNASIFLHFLWKHDNRFDVVDVNTCVPPVVLIS